MAILNLTIHNVNLSRDPKKEELVDVILSTEEKKDAQGVTTLVKKVLNLPNLGNQSSEQSSEQSAEQSADYNLSLINLQFHKKMYQPTEIIAEISVTKAKGAWVPVSREVIVNLFDSKKVSLEDVQRMDNDPVFASSFKKVGEDFYVQTVRVSYRDRFMRIFLSIYSLDNLMRIQKNCRTFVGQKLGADILPEVNKFTAPYDPQKKLAFDASSMKNLSYNMANGNPTEHIFPYLVQYNESFYDMLARTTNRWGEFMFYENGKLNIGCPNKEQEKEKKEVGEKSISKSVTTAKQIDDYMKNNALVVPTSQKEYNDHKNDVVRLPMFYSLDYVNLEELTTNGDKFDCAAGYDDNIQSSPIQEDPNYVSGNLFTPGGKIDKVIMKKFASFFKNNRNLATFLGNELFSDLYDLGKQNISVKTKNDTHNDKYFKDQDKTPEKYGDHKFDRGNFLGYNPFSEIETIYDKKKYFDILKNEISAAEDAICINFDTTYPCLKLGQIISVYGKEYIVVQVDCNTHIPEMVQDNIWVISSGKAVYSFQVIAVAKQGGQFYPTVIPSGHVRLAEPQMAKVADAGDPNNAGRVRVLFTWQGDKDTASPWLQFTANAGGKKGLMGKHYKDDKVFVGFIDGNVERPYVLGAISKGADADVHFATPGGQVFKLSDDKAGIKGFLTSMFCPIYGTLSDYIPGFGDVNDFQDVENNLSLAGGFELSDNYGIYKISGSTNKRNVSISSAWGDVSIDAFTGLTLSAPNGNVTIRGKNITLEAGNNLNLTSGKNVSSRLFNHKDTDGGTTAQFFTDLPVAVAKKLAETLLNVVDLSIVRHTVEVLMRPVEGSLTVKSNRFLKLEAGKNSCALPETAYRPDKLQKKIDELNDQVKGTINGGVFLNVHKGIAELLQKIPGYVKDIDAVYKKHYNRAVQLKRQLERHIGDLNCWKNSVGSVDAYVLNRTFEEAYTAWIPDLWAEGEYKPFEEKIFGFNEEEVTIEGQADSAVSARLYNTKNDLMIRMAKIENPNVYKVAQAIVDERKRLRGEALKTLNELRKEICALMNIETKKKKDFYNMSWYVFTSMPADFKTKLVKALDKSNFKGSSYFDFTVDVERKNLAGLLNGETALPKNQQVYLERIIAMKLLEELGFKDNMRKPVPVQPGNGNNPIPPVPVPAPTITIKPDIPFSIMDDDIWRGYVDSLSGIPPIKLDRTTLGKAFDDAIENQVIGIGKKIYFWKGMGEKFDYAEGKTGQILFGSDGKTYALKDKTFTDVKSLKATVTHLSADDFEHPSTKKMYNNFIDKIKDEMKKFR